MISMPLFQEIFPRWKLSIKFFMAGNNSSCGGTTTHYTRFFGNNSLTTHSCPIFKPIFWDTVLHFRRATERETAKRCLKTLSLSLSGWFLTTRGILMSWDSEKSYLIKGWSEILRSARQQLTHNSTTPTRPKNSQLTQLELLPAMKFFINDKTEFHERAA